METTKPLQKASSDSRISNETFITLFMIVMLVIRPSGLFGLGEAQRL